MMQILLIIFCSIIGVSIGYLIGTGRFASKTTARLRKRGYTIECRNSYYDGNSYRFSYNGFDDKLRAIKIEGPYFSDYNDAVANADAHFFANITNNQTLTGV